MRVVAEALLQVGNEEFQWVGCDPSSNAGNSFSVQVGPDRLSIMTQVVGDGRNRLSPFFQCVYFHVFSLCEHEEWVPSVGWRKHHQP